MPRIRVLVVDDHPLFRDGLRALLTAAPETECVGEAASGAAAVSQAQALVPDVILMDLHMPELNGIAATQRILATQPHIGIIALTMLEDDASVFAAMCAGARGYVLKGADKAEVLKTIRAVASGEALFGPAIARRLSHFFYSLQASSQTVAPPPPFPELTEREREVLDLIAQGQSNSAIAERLVITPKTVSNHISNIFGKLQVADRAQAIVRARAAGLGHDG